jgi:hypothetical protein
MFTVLSNSDFSLKKSISLKIRLKIRLSYEPLKYYLFKVNRVQGGGRVRFTATTQALQTNKRNKELLHND